jgi:NAD(P)H dehydrogenase (quinone)
MKNIIVITGASSGFGALAARALAIRWEEVFRAQGMKNPTPRIQMIEGFNEGWIEFKGSVKGHTSLKTVLEEMVRDARKQAA